MTPHKNPNEYQKYEYLSLGCLNMLVCVCVPVCVYVCVLVTHKYLCVNKLKCHLQHKEKKTNKYRVEALE